jgi:nitrite reductase/ring-hydroxylating ferredoxin subunit
MTSEPQGTRSGPDVTRRGVLLGAGLAGLGGMLAGCSTAAVPYGANEAGVLPRSRPAPSAMTTPASPISPGSAGILLGVARDIPVGGGRIFTTERVVVTQPSRGQFRAFSAVCTHVGCVLNEVAGGTIDCPCHGSKFRITNGTVVTGPASRPLPEKQIAITEGRIILL